MQRLTNLRTAYSLLGRLAYYLLIPLLYVYGKSSRKPRVRALLFHKNNVLLVKNWLSPQLWTLPGGGVGFHETEQQALVRELKEELGILVSCDNLRYIGTLLYDHNPAPFHISVYSFNYASHNRIAAHTDKKEIIDMQWFSLRSLPHDISPEFERAYALYSKSNPKL